MNCGNLSLNDQFMFVNLGVTFLDCQSSPTVDCVNGLEVLSRVSSSNSILFIDEAGEQLENHQDQRPISTAAQPPSVDVSAKSKEVGHRGLILLVPMRLGAGAHIDSVYIPTLLHLLRDPSCVGLIGGRPKHSMYVTGCQADRLIFHDPHFCQNTVSMQNKCFNLNVSGRISRELPVYYLKNSKLCRLYLIGNV